MSFLIPAVFFSLLFFDIKGREKGKARNICISLSAIAALASVCAAFLANRDHIGASLSGMISIFMR